MQVMGEPVVRMEVIELPKEPEGMDDGLEIIFAERQGRAFPIRINGEKVETPEWKSLSFWVKLLLDFLVFWQTRKNN